MKTTNLDNIFMECMNDGLKDCPCCGHRAKLHFLDDLNKTSGYWIACTNVRECGIHTYTMNNKEEAIKIWNNRAE